MTRRTTKAQRREWQERVTAMPTQADIDRCKELWPEDWQDKLAFYNGQVASLLADNTRLRAELVTVMEIVRAVALNEYRVTSGGDPCEYVLCLADDLRLAARALLKLPNATTAQ